MSDEENKKIVEEEPSEKVKISENSSEDDENQVKVQENESDKDSNNISKDDESNQISNEKAEDSEQSNQKDTNQSEDDESRNEDSSMQNEVHKNFDRTIPYENSASEDSEQPNQNDQTNQEYVPNNNIQYDELNPYGLKEDDDIQSDKELDLENIESRSIEDKEKDDDISISSNSSNQKMPRAISADDIATVEEPGGVEGSKDKSSFFTKFKWPLISSGITLVFIIITAAVAGGAKTDVRMHTIEKTLEIVNKVGGYIIWAIHCVGLLVLPFLFVILFKDEVKFYQIWGPPVMMFLNMIGGFLPIKGSFFPIIVELLITMYYLFHLPFKPVYVPKTEDFWKGEITLMFLAFIYISCALGSSTLSYLLYGSYIRVQGHIISGPSNPHYAIDYINLLNALGYYDMKVKGGYLACYSLFTFLSVGIGIAMSMKNSILMSIPFLMLAICTVIETHGIGILLFCQLAIHILYIIFLQFHKTRKLIVGQCCYCCYECCYATLTTIMIGDIIGFCLVAFPILQFSIYHETDTKFSWGGFIGGSFVIFIGIIFHVLYSFDEDRWWQLILACAGFLGGSLLFGLKFSGYVPIIRAFTYEITYITWSFALCFWGYSSGYSPFLFKTYNSLISLAALVVVEVYEGIGWMEILFAIIQVVFDVIIVIYVQRLSTKYIAWTVFSVSGIIVLGFLVGVVVVLLTILAFYILSVFCSCCSEISIDARAHEIAQTLNVGDTFECAGRTYIVTAG